MTCVSVCFLLRFGAYLTVLYLTTKILYFVNVVGQLFLLNSILATKYSIYGIEVSTSAWTWTLWACRDVCVSGEACREVVRT